MSTTVRSATAALLSVPLVLSLSAPALAATPDKYSASGSFAYVDGLAVGQISGLPGNVHAFYVEAQDATDGSFGGGYLGSFMCPDGVTTPYGGEEGPEGPEPLCEFVGSYELRSEDVTLITGKKLSTARLNGTFDALSWPEECYEFEYECEPMLLTSLPIDLHFTATSASSTARYRDSYRDPDTGYWSKGMSTVRSRAAEVSGTVGGAEVTDAMGEIGTFKFRTMEKM